MRQEKKSLLSSIIKCDLKQNSAGLKGPLGHAVGSREGGEEHQEKDTSAEKLKTCSFKDQTRTRGKE